MPLIFGVCCLVVAAHMVPAARAAAGEFFNGLLVSTVIIMAALTVYGGREFWTGAHFAYALTVAVLGGFIAPVARDLVAAMESLRNRPR
ncbi:hypothetical protein [Methylococcus capsulatus]|uniref:hypothetical protein n=2 Tax=Methylococcaceae TaxID=403 RepID=UPI001C527A82|nr:hypothetical protein [Methylococcus capsulatus]QXP88688.1 hypothetical protein KW112_06170 [Methylococcus capsulatus]QXP94280.1 hypothetical protein KW113_03465 [Methylococcus capsulatus]UQN10965.1 hypothetical protein M3M30_07895 [Methylococcus capsulatus]